ncbi:MAG: alpha/beta hydrolase [Candidatus Tectomicrobia bacterium]|nr:alpha/beta hydrolase [Candidatus Tectomicrobia bacterium]
MPLISLNGIDLYYESNGEGESVTFLHGAGGNHASWWQQAPSFSQTYRCLTLDHRGFGWSTDPQGKGAACFADDLEALLDELSIERTALVAQSMGGRTASQFTLRHPERVSALVMCDTLGILAWEELSERREKLRAERLATAGESGALSRGYMAPGFIKNQPEMTYLYQQVQSFNPPRADTSPQLTTRRDELTRLSVPTLFIVGSEDPVLPTEIVREVAEAVPDAELLEFDSCGHSVYWENAPEFNRSLGSFLAKHL